jgi:arylsulfatase A-like enzyme
MRNRGIGIHSLALSSVPHEIRGTGPAEKAGNAIMQKPGSVLSWYVEVPAGGSLSGSGLLSGADAALAEQCEGLVTLALTEDDGRQTVAISRPFRELCDGPEIPISLDLSEYAGQMIGITLSYWMASPVQEARELAASACTIQWEELTLRSKQLDIDRTSLGGALDALRGNYNVLVILFDTLRADYTQTYGGEITASTPHLTELADAGTLFRDCSANSSWTRTSVTSILSSLTPQTHGVLGSTAALPEKLPYLPELLGQVGYKTLCVTNNGIFPPALGFDRGFDTYFQLYSLRTQSELDGLDTPEKMATFVWDRSIAPFLEQASDAPFFVYLHEIDPHAPWEPVPPFGDMYDYDYDSTLKCERDVTNMLRNESLPLSNEDLRNFQAGYMAEISFMDGYLGTMREKLRAAGLEDNTILLFISDHGEEFLEHGLIGHYWSQYEESLRVPMVWSLPGKIPAGRRNTAHVQLIDIPPTLLDMLNIPVPDVFEGRSLLPHFILPEDADIATPCYGATRTNWRWSLRLGKNKLCKHRTGNIGELSRQYEYLLFDLERDPGEQYDLWADRLTTGKALRQMLEWREYTGSQSHFDVKEVEPRRELSPEEEEDLRALGYL